MSAITVEERIESRKTTQGDDPTIELRFWISGTSDDLTARACLAAVAPAIYLGLVRKEYTVDPISSDLWDGTVSYGRRKKPETGESSYQFDTGGGSQKITQSLGTTRYAKAGETAPDFKGAIGVTKDNVEGVDIQVPEFHFGETHYLPVAAVDAAYKLLLYTITGCTNNAPWRGYAAGEVLFLGASGSQRSEDDWEISYKFAASPNITGLTIGEITDIAKGGWQYLWTRYEDAEDTAAKCLVKKPKAVYVETVYRSADFSLLGIG